MKQIRLGLMTQGLEQDQFRQILPRCEFNQGAAQTRIGFNGFRLANAIEAAALGQHQLIYHK
jgi:hypothetical protein